MKKSKLTKSLIKKIIKEESQKLLFENVVCDTRNNNPFTGVSGTCPAVAGQGSQTCTANFPGNGNAGTCGPASVAPGGGTPTGGGPIGVADLAKSAPSTPANIPAPDGKITKQQIRNIIKQSLREMLK